MDSPSISERRHTARGRHAANTRHHPDRTDLIEAGQAELAELALEAHIRKVVDGSPPLSAAQRDRLAALLRPSAAVPVQVERLTREVQAVPKAPRIGGWRMRHPRKRSGGPPQAPAATKITATTKQLDQRDGSATVVLPVTVDPPCPGRQLWTYRVRDRRGHVHLHRGGPPRDEGHLREAPCGESYLIVGGVA